MQDYHLPVEPCPPENPPPPPNAPLRRLLPPKIIAKKASGYTHHGARLFLYVFFSGALEVYVRVLL